MTVEDFNGFLAYLIVEAGERKKSKKE